MLTAPWFPGGGIGPRRCRADERVRVGRPYCRVYLARVQVAEVEGTNHGFWDACGKGNGDPEALTANGIVDAGTAEMGAVREVSPRVVLEAVPLLHEVVATVVPDLNDLWMGGADFRDMWRVQNDLAAVGDDRLYLVEPLGACPDVVVSGRESDRTLRTGASRYRM